jgi:hypothetical protein
MADILVNDLLFFSWLLQNAIKSILTKQWKLALILEDVGVNNDLCEVIQNNIEHGILSQNFNFVSGVSGPPSKFRYR